MDIIKLHVSLLSISNYLSLSDMLTKLATGISSMIYFADMSLAEWGLIQIRIIIINLDCTGFWVHQ